MSEAYIAESNEQFVEENPELSEEELQSIVASAIEDAADFIDNSISPGRAEAAEYYQGEAFGNEQAGRSTAMTMDVRDTIQAMLPSLVRIFCGSDHVVEYAPVGPEDVEHAKQATDYANFILNQDQDESYISIIYATFKDALVKGSGFLKYYWDESEDVKTYSLTGLDEQALAALNSDPSVEITLMSTEISDTSPDPLTSVTVVQRRSTGQIKVATVPPEEILVSRQARSFADAGLVAHRRYATVSELVEMGYKYDDIIDYATDDADFDLLNVEARERQLSQQSRDYADPTRRRVLYVEAYMQIDVDGDGVSELRRICCAGPSYEILRNETTDDVPFAMFCPDPEPHAFFGMSIADLTMDIQRIKSAVLRASLDSLAMSTHPRVGVVEGQASLEDVMNVEAGGIIRMRNPGAVVPFTLPYVGSDAFSMMEYLDEIRENRTGISKAADGLAPEALQSSTLMAVNQTIQAAQQRTELIARLFAENGMTRLFKGLLRLMVQHQDRPRMIRLRNEFVPMQPDAWNAGMDVVANIALGKGGDTEKMMMLQEVAGKQEMLIEKLGPDNPLVNIQNYYATLQQMIELAGFKDPNKFFTDPSQMPPAPPEPPKPDINEQLIQVQMAEIQANIQKKQAELALEREKMVREDDRRRDKDEADIALKAAEIIARYGAQVDMAGIKAGSERDREMVKQLSSVRNGQNRTPIS